MHWLMIGAALVATVLSGTRAPASLVGANGKLYLATEEGDVVVVRMGDEFEVLAPT